MKSSVTPLSNWSTANGPYDVGSASPSAPPTSRAAAQVSLAWTSVWLKSMLTDPPSVNLLGGHATADLLGAVLDATTEVSSAGGTASQCATQFRAPVVTPWRHTLRSTTAMRAGAAGVAGSRR